MTEAEWWTIAQAAAHCGVGESTYRSYVARQGAPAPALWDPHTGKKLVDAAAVREWQGNRKGRGHRSDLDTPNHTAADTPDSEDQP